MSLQSAGLPAPMAAVDGAVLKPGFTAGPSSGAPSAASSNNSIDQVLAYLTDDLKTKAEQLKRSQFDLAEMECRKVSLESEVLRLRNRLADQKKAEQEFLGGITPEVLSSENGLSPVELAQKLQTLIVRYKSLKNDHDTLRDRHAELTKEAATAAGLSRELQISEAKVKALAADNETLSRECKKTELYRTTIQNQEEVIHKLEVAAENSLSDLMKASKRENELNKLRHENAKLKDRVMVITAASGLSSGLGHAGEDGRGLHDGRGHDGKHTHENAKGITGIEIDAINKLQRDLEKSNTELAQVKEQLEAAKKSGQDSSVSHAELIVLKAQKEELELRASVAEERTKALEDQLKEGSRTVAKQLGDLKLQLAKKEAELREAVRIAAHAAASARPDASPGSLNSASK